MRSVITSSARSRCECQRHNVTRTQSMRVSGHSRCGVRVTTTQSMRVSADTRIDCDASVSVTTSSGRSRCDNETADLIACTTTTLNSSGISDMNDVICFISRSTLLSLPVYNTLIFITSHEYSSCHMIEQSSCIMTNNTTHWPSSTQLQAGSLTGNW